MIEKSHNNPNMRTQDKMKVSEQEIAGIIVGYRDTATGFEEAALRFGLSRMFFDEELSLSPTMRADIETWCIRNDAFENVPPEEQRAAWALHYRLNWDNEAQVMRCTCGHEWPIQAKSTFSECDFSKPCPNCAEVRLFV